MSGPTPAELDAVLAPLDGADPDGWRTAMMAAERLLAPAAYPADRLAQLSECMKRGGSGQASALLEVTPALGLAISRWDSARGDALEWLALTPALLQSADTVSWKHGLGVLWEHGGAWDVPLALGFLLDHRDDLSISGSALQTVVHMMREHFPGPHDARVPEVLDGLAANAWSPLVVWLLTRGKHLPGTERLLPRVFQQVPLSFPATRHALEAVGRMLPEEANRLAAAALAETLVTNEPDWNRRVAAASWMLRSDQEPLRQVLVEALSTPGLSADQRAQATDQLDALSANQAAALLAAATSASLSSEDANHRKTVLETLRRIRPHAAVEPALGLLKDGDAGVRTAAIETLATADDPALVEHLLPLTRDPVVSIRQAALRAVTSHRDPRVRGELVSALWDVSDDVRNLAKQLLEEREPRIGRFRPMWEVLRERVNDVLLWGQEVGEELLGRQVKLRQHPDGLGRTWSSKEGPVDIEISDRPVTHAAFHGEDVMRGLVLHEIGHHLYDFAARGHRTMTGIAKSEKLADLYEILLDERLERKLRARRPEWGHYLDRLASHAFAQGQQRIPLQVLAQLYQRDPEDVAADIRARTLPGRLLPRVFAERTRWVALSGRELLLVPNFLPRVSLFLAFLRCGFDRSLCRDPVVLEALDLVPRTLKDLPHSEVLQVARRLAKLLGHQDQQRQELARLRRIVRDSRGGLRGLEGMLDRIGHLCDHQHGSENPGGTVPIRDFEPIPVKDASPSSRSRGVLDPGRIDRRARGGRQYNVNPDRDFKPLLQEETLEHDPTRHAELVGSIRKHVRVLRAYLERLSVAEVEEYASRRGRRLDHAMARRVAHVPTTNLLVFRRNELRPDAYIGVLIDRSGSMAGARIQVARAFGALVAESARGLPGIEGHVSAFDHQKFVHLGGFQRNAIASLESMGGNNDSAGLARAADLAFRSKRRNLLLIMISDGLPTECTFDSLKHLVERLTQQGVLCAQVAVSSLPQVAFPHYVDLSAHTFDEAVARFGRLLIRLTRSWR